jgi:hypothetical protein
MMDDQERREELARDILATLDGVAPTALMMAGSSLLLTDEPWASFGQAIRYCGTARAGAGGADTFATIEPRLAVLAMSGALRLAATTHAEQVFDRLNGVEQQPWPAVRSAVNALAESCAATDYR